MLKLKLLFITCLSAILTVSGQPTNNPVSELYPGEYPWTDQIPWSNVFDINAFGGNPNGIQDNLSAFNAAQNAAVAAGGGVVFFPAGNYYFSDHMYVKSKIALRGVKPILTNAKDPAFTLTSVISFPKYTPTFTAADTANRKQAFKDIQLFKPDSTENIAFAWLSINRGGLKLLRKQKSYFGDYPTIQSLLQVSNRNFSVVGCKVNHDAFPDERVPAVWQDPWQIYPNRFDASVKVYVTENCLVANCKFNDDRSEDFEMPGYKVECFYNPCKTDPSTITVGTRKVYVSSATQVKFSYSDHSTIMVNQETPIDGQNWWYLTEAEAPFLYHKNIHIRDNWMYRTKRYGIHASGDGLYISNNEIHDASGTGKITVAGPTGTLEAKPIDFQIRGIWVKGGRNILVNKNLVIANQLLTFWGNFPSNDGEGIVVDQQGADVENYTVRDNDVTANWIGNYDITNCKRVSFINNTLRPNNGNSNQYFWMRCETKVATQRPVAGGPFRTYPGTCEYCVVDSNNFIKGTQGQWNVELSPITQNRFTNNITSGLAYTLKVSTGDSLIFCNNSTITPTIADLSTAICRPYDTTGINEFQEMIYRIKIAPNPSKGIFSLLGEGQIDELLLMDCQGRKVVEKTGVVLPEKINFNQNPEGLYILRIGINGRAVTHKIRKE